MFNDINGKTLATLLFAFLAISPKVYSDQYSIPVDVSNPMIISSSVLIEKMQMEGFVQEQHYLFKYCDSSVNVVSCEIIGSEQGYTQKEIEQLFGRWKQLGAVLYGAGAAVGVFYLSVSGGMIAGSVMVGALGTGELGTMAALVVGFTTTYGVGHFLVDMMSAVSPLRMYQKGGVETVLIKNIRALSAAQDQNLAPVFVSADKEQAIKFARFTQEILSTYKKD